MEKKFRTIHNGITEQLVNSLDNIYEGDIITAPSHHSSKYGDGTYIVESIEKYYFECGYDEEFAFFNKIVIGNIHEGIK